MVFDILAQMKLNRLLHIKFCVCQGHVLTEEAKQSPSSGNEKTARLVIDKLEDGLPKV